jgi:peroxiredoxin Q/BCP
MISPNQKIPTTLRLKMVQSGGESEVALADLLSRRLIVSVYMKNNTPSCDRQNESLAAAADEFDRLGYTLVALSRDGCGSHRNYAKKKGLPHLLASDPDDAFARAADALVEKSMYGRTFIGPARAAFVLDRDGTVLAVVPKVDASDHAAQLKAVIAGLG